MEIADEIVVMSNGKIEQVGTPEEVYENPATPFVMNFIGAVNVLSPDHTWQIHSQPVSPSAGEVFLRPHDIDIFTAPTDGSLPATIKYVIHLGWTIRVELTLENGQPVTAHINRDQYKTLNIQPKQTVYLKARLIHSFEDAPAYSKSVA
jgi:sulfate transport system ATP-binding protein